MPRSRLALVPALALTVLFSGLFSAATTWAAPSAKRAPNESYRSILTRHQAELLKKRTSRWSVQRGRSALSAAVPLAQADTSSLPEWTSPSDLDSSFKEIRDKRFLEDEAHPGFLRRMSWLYPDDGCFARAELAAKELKSTAHPAPGKIFVFGNLSVQTENSTTGSVSWWYHVVVGYRIGQTAFVVDPAIDASRPLTLREWTDRMGGEEADIQISFCSAETFEPDSSCLHADELSPEAARREQEAFLPSEWERVEELGRRPEKVLGDEPPWQQSPNQTLSL